MAGFTVRVEAPSRRSGMTLDQALARVSTGAAHGLAEALFRRVFVEGKPADRPSPYDTDGPKTVSPRYPATGGIVSARSGVRTFASNAAFHQQQRTGLWGGPSGGLAQGLSVVPGSRDSRIAFRGRSEGQDVVWRKLKGGFVARGRRVSNALKAATIANASGVNPLAITPEEVSAMSLAVTESLRDGLLSIGGYRVTWTSAGVSGLASRVLEAIRSKG